jgi:hypothetical protein
MSQPPPGMTMAQWLNSPEYIAEAEARVAEERRKREAVQDMEDQRREYYAAQRRAQVDRQRAQVRAAENEEQRQLLAAILTGDLDLAEIDPQALRGEKARETLMLARSIWDVLLQFRLDALAHESLAYLAQVQRDSEKTTRERTEAAKAILAARSKLAIAPDRADAALRAVVGTQKRSAVQTRALSDEQMHERFREILSAATDEGD